MEDFFIQALHDYGYIILFIWSIMEGELGLIMAGTMAYTGAMSLCIAIPVAALGGFVGDQVYFYLGRFNKRYIQSELKNHRRKFALAHLLLKKYGWSIIFIQRYLYGMRTVIPMAIGITKYSSKKYAIINFFSAIVWASITILLSYYFGKQMLKGFEFIKEHKGVLIPIALIFGGSVYYYFHFVTKKNYS